MSNRGFTNVFCWIGHASYNIILIFSQMLWCTVMHGLKSIAIKWVQCAKSVMTANSSPSEGVTCYFYHCSKCIIQGSMNCSTPVRKRNIIIKKPIYRRKFKDLIVQSSLCVYDWCAHMFYIHHSFEALRLKLGQKLNNWHVLWKKGWIVKSRSQGHMELTTHWVAAKSTRDNETAKALCCCFQSKL